MPAGARQRPAASRRRSRHLTPVGRLRTEDQEVTAILGTVTDEQVECVAGRHDWAMDDWRIGEQIPDEVQFEPWSANRYQVRDPCLNACGTVRTSLTRLAEDGSVVLDAYASYSYEYGDDWVHVPAEYGRVSKRRYRTEKNRRGGAAVAARIRQASQAAVPQATFSGAG